MPPPQVLESTLAAPLERPIVGASEPIQTLATAIERVARAPRTTVLITGESGVGKELAARAVHERSKRAARPFVAVNCAALTDSLLEAELFGYEPGAFTGADPKGRLGLIAAAESGTLFLDEIGELAPLLQAKLLRFLQERVYRRVGSTRDLAMDVRVIACTNRDLASLVAQGTFREDLFYRLNVLSLRVPALRERSSDIELLARHFLVSLAEELEQVPSELSPSALERLKGYPWPGNVRELRNCMERAALLGGGATLQADDLELTPPPTSASLTPFVPSAGASMPFEDLSLRSVEEAVIRHVLLESGGNRSQAARVLGVNRTTLYNKLRAYSIE